MAVDTPATIAVIGAGPVGLEAALYARFLGYNVQVYERQRVATTLLAAGHVRLYTPWQLNGSPLGVAALRAQDPTWRPPDDEDLLTCGELAERYFLPLAASDLLSDSVREEIAVVGIERCPPVEADNFDDGDRGAVAPDEGTDDGTDDGAADADLEPARRPPFALRLSGPGGAASATADVVIDASGRGRARGLGPQGEPASGEREAGERVSYGLVDPLGRDRQRYAGARTLLVGGGCTAATNALALAELAAATADTEIVWATRGEPVAGQGGPLAISAGDPLAERARLRRAANSLAVDPQSPVRWLPVTTVAAVRGGGDTIRVTFAGRDAGEADFDRLIINTGWQADADHCAGLDAAPVDPAASGPRRLLRAEPDFYILGPASALAGREFLFVEALAQIRDLFTILGDRAGLDLYRTV